MKKIVLIVLLFCLWHPVVAAQPVTVEETYEWSGLEQVYDGLSGQVKDTLTDWGITPETLMNGQGVSLSGVFRTLGELVHQTAVNPLTALGMGLGILLLCGLLKGMSPGEETPLNGAIGYFAGLCMIVTIVLPAGYTLSKTAAALSGVSVFMLAFVPVYLGLFLLSGKLITSSGAGSLVFGVCQVISYGVETYLMPLVGMVQALAVCESVAVGVHINGFTSFLKKCVTWGLGIVITVFTGVLSLTGMINAAGDSLTQRTTRFFIGNMVPVIGGAISDSMGTLQSCFSLLKTGGGVLALAVVAVMVLPVVVEILLWRLVTMALVAAAETLQIDTLTGLLKTLGEAMSLLFSIVVCCFVVYLVCLSALMLAGGS